MIFKQQFTVPLAAGQNQVSSWLDNGNAGAELLASASIYSDAGGQVWIDQTDSKDDPNLYLMGFGAQIVPPGKLTVIQWPISHVHWRVNYTNGSVAQTTFHLVITASVSSESSVLLELQKVNFNLKRLINPFNPKDDELNISTGVL